MIENVTTQTQLSPQALRPKGSLSTKVQVNTNIRGVDDDLDASAQANIFGGSTIKVMASRNRWETIMRESGLRVTQPRLVVLEVLDAYPHSSAEEILVLAGDALDTLSLQSVYNVLGDLTRIGMLRSLELPHQPARYELDNGDNHHHAVCTVCGRTYNVPCAVGHAPCLVPSDDHNMHIDIADVIYRGICEDCRSSAASANNAKII